MFISSQLNFKQTEIYNCIADSKPRNLRTAMPIVFLFAECNVYSLPLNIAKEADKTMKASFIPH